MPDESSALPPVNGHSNAKGPAQPQSPATPSFFSFGRPRASESRPSISSSTGHQRNLTMSQGTSVSVVLISSALEIIANSREAKRSAPLKESVEHALNMVRSGQGGDKPREIFEPLRLACETRSEKLMIASLDCISKLISYSFFAESGTLQSEDKTSPPTSPAPTSRRNSAMGSQVDLAPPSLVDAVTHTITSCHEETTSDAVSLQIVKALLALVLSPTLLVHHSSLLKAIRTVYNVFLFSPDPVNQTVAQGGLTQMVHHVFTRCNIRLNTTESAENLEAQTLVSESIQSRQSYTHDAPTSPTPDILPIPPLAPPYAPEGDENIHRRTGTPSEEGLENTTQTSNKHNEHTLEQYLPSQGPIDSAHVVENGSRRVQSPSLQEPNK